MGWQVVNPVSLNIRNIREQALTGNKCIVLNTLNVNVELACVRVLTAGKREIGHRSLLISLHLSGPAEDPAYLLQST